jgi:hypothetical protein
MPVVSAALGNKLASLIPDAIQRFPVTIAGATKRFEILNVTSVVRCLDESRSSITYWQPSDGRPDKVGQYQIVLNEVIDATRAASAQLFRLGGWEIEIVAATPIQSALFGQFTGLCFQPLGDSVPDAAV